MAYLLLCKCPKCEKLADGYDEITEVFGWRTVNGKTIPQSHCRKCRAKKVKVTKVKE